MSSAFDVILCGLGAWLVVSVIFTAALCRCIHAAKQREKQFQDRFGSMED